MKQVFIEYEKCLACKSCEIACAVEHSISKNLISAIFEKPLPQKRVHVESAGPFSLSLRCMHCEEAPCIEACPSAALRRDMDTGMVYNVEDRCIGCWMCVMVCPFGVIYPNREHRIALKCDGCLEKVKAYQVPVCVQACPSKALVFGELEEIMREKRKVTANIVALPPKREEEITRKEAYLRLFRELKEVST